MFSQCASRFFLATSLIFANVLGTPLVERNQIDDFGGSATIQWSDAAGNHLRNYHIRDDCTIMESIYEPGWTGWGSQALPFCGDENMAIVGVVIKGNDGGPEVIQLFYRDNNKNSMRSIFWMPSSGWSNDAGFNSKNFNAKPDAAIAWKTPQGTKNIRLYAYSIDVVDAGDSVAGMSDVYEFAWVAGIGWSATNGGKKLFHSSGDLPWSGGISATVSPHGQTIRLFFWDRKTDPASALDPTPHFVNQAVWTGSTGWKIEGTPHHDLTGFRWSSPMVAINYGEGTTAGEQIRLYIKWKTGTGVRKFKEFISDKGTWHEGQALPDFALDRVLFTQPSAVVWTYPDVSNVHIRLYNARCHVSGGCRPYIHEVGFDTIGGWFDGKDIDAEPA